MRFVWTTIFLITFLFPVRSQTTGRHTVSGYVREAVSGEYLTGVNIYLPATRSGTVTNTYGFYSITLSSTDSVELIFSYIGYTPVNIKVALNKDLELNIEMKSNIMLKEVTITGEMAERQSETAKMSSVKLQVAQVKNLPSLLGEKDILKVLQLMPGVQKGMEGSSGIYVRGGGPDQNLIILDDAIVYNASHLFGFFSIFNGDALKSVELIKGGFPARYGGRLSSVLDMNMKEGNKEEWHGEGGIGIISSRLTIEGPLSKNKSSILLSGRRTYADVIMRPLLKSADQDNTGYYFYDFNAKVNYDFGRKNKLFLSGYFGKDKFYLKKDDQDVKENAGFLWRNATGTLRWNHLYNSKLFANTSLVFSNYTFGIYDEYKVVAEQKNYYAEYNSGITDLTFKHDFDFIPGTNHMVKAGILAISHAFKPYAFVQIDENLSLNTNEAKTTRGLESGIYIEDTWRPIQNLKINGGMRFSHFASTRNRYHYFEPRLTAAWRFLNDYAVKGSYSEMNQYIHLISNTGINLPTDLWVPTTDRIKPQHSKQVAFGVVKDLRIPELSFSIEGYYKKMINVLGYKEGASFLQLDEPGSSAGISWENNVTAGRAWSYGVEFLLEKKAGKLTGWIGYTLSWTQMQFDSLNFGKKYYARYDRRHDLSVVGIYKINDRITFSGTWVYGTGNAITMPMSSYNAIDHGQIIDYMKFSLGGHFQFPGSDVNEYPEKNNFRMSSYHRLDLGIQFHKQKKWGERTWEISVYNAYNRRNAFYYYIERVFDETTGKFYGQLKQVSLFPVIPSFSYSFRF